MNYRLVHNNNEVITITEASGVTNSNGHEIVEASIDEIYRLISELNLTNVPPMSAFNF